jgi:6-phosphogluconolactonase (cycloisomerase 2 family)
MSNSVSIFDISADANLKLNQSISSAMPFSQDLGQPVSLALSPSNDELYVVGFEKHQLTIFDRDGLGRLKTKQVIFSGEDNTLEFLNPQKILVSPDGNLLFVACSGSHSIVVFQKQKEGEFKISQSISDIDVGDSALTGVSSLALSPDGSQLYAAGEKGEGLVIFKVDSDGHLNLENRLSEDGSTQKNKLTGISSIAISNDGQYLMLTMAKNNSLLVYEIRK